MNDTIQAQAEKVGPNYDHEQMYVARPLPRDRLTRSAR
jgi:hypothetical protein